MAYVIVGFVAFCLGFFAASLAAAAGRDRDVELELTGLPAPAPHYFPGNGPKHTIRVQDQSRFTRYRSRGPGLQPICTWCGVIVRDTGKCDCSDDARAPS